MTVLVEVPFEFFTDLNGDALDAGFIYVGEQNKDPESNEIVTYWDSELSKATGQPIRTISGYPKYNGSPGKIYISESNYSITVRDKNRKLVYTSLANSGSSIGSSAESDGDAPANRIISGAVRTNSEAPDFIDFTGSGADATILGATTSLVLSINNVEVTVDTDLPITGLTVAPSANNTCLVDDADLTDQLSSKYTGEDDSTLTITAAGSEITSRVGKVIALQKNGSTEIMLAYVKSTTQLTNVYRGYFYDSASDPIVRETLADGDQLNILSLGWVFVQNDGLTTDVTYTNPVYSYSQPTGAVGDYWFDMTNNVWKRFAASWVQINRTLVGMVAIGTTITIGKRESDFWHDYRDTNTILLEIFSDEVIRSDDKTNNIYVYSDTLRIDPTKVTWDNTNDMETGSVAASTTYYLYLASTGQRIVSLEKYYTRNDLRGKYHPYEAWRYTGNGTTDGTSDWLTVVTETILSYEDPEPIGPTDAGTEVKASRYDHSHSLILEKDTKVADYTILTTDRNKMIELGALNAADRIFTFDSLGEDEDGYMWIISNDSFYNLTVAVSDTDHIWNSGDGYGVELPDKGTTIILRYDHTNTKLDIINKTGGMVLIEEMKLHEKMNLISTSGSSTTATRVGKDSTGRHNPTVKEDIINDTEDVSKFPPGCFTFDGTGDHLFLKDSTDWDVFGTLSGHKTIAGWIFTDTVAVGTDSIMTQYEDGSNNWEFLRTAAALQLLYLSDVATNISISGGTLVVETWHHVALIFDDNKLGIYLDGVQVAYSLFTADTFTGNLSIGQDGASGSYWLGKMQDMHISFNNPYNAAPNATPDDTFTAPSAPFEGIML